MYLRSWVKNIWRNIMLNVNYIEIRESLLVILIGITIDIHLTFKIHIENLFGAAKCKLHEFNYALIIWMFYGRVYLKN